MRQLRFFSILTIPVMGLVLILSFQPVNAGDDCYNCGPGSAGGIHQCRYHGRETYEQRKKCEAAGCRVTGTSACSTAPDVKVIDPN
ncbi:MAG: hypothetical protein JXA07_16585 [Spirochaetes bacterium]|nr:hypothetical protein [Spirochaetota bacterium]